MTVTDETINMRFIDPSHVCMASLELQNNKHYKLDQLDQALNNTTFELSVKDVIKILSRIEDNTTIINAEKDNQGQLLGINFIINSNETNETVKEIQIPAFEYEMRADIPQLKYNDDIPKAKMEIDNIVDSIHEINDYETDTLTISNNGMNILLEATSTRNTRKRIKITKFENIDFQDISEKQYDGTEYIQGKFSMEYLNYLIVGSNAYSEIDLIYGTQMPLSLCYSGKESTDKNLLCILAPRIEE